MDNSSTPPATKQEPASPRPLAALVAAAVLRTRTAMIAGGRSTDEALDAVERAHLDPEVYTALQTLKGQSR